MRLILIPWDLFSFSFLFFLACFNDLENGGENSVGSSNLVPLTPCTTCGMKHPLALCLYYTRVSNKRTSKRRKKIAFVNKPLPDTTRILRFPLIVGRLRGEPIQKSIPTPWPNLSQPQHHVLVLEYLKPAGTPARLRTPGTNICVNSESLIKRASSPNLAAILS